MNGDDQDDAEDHGHQGGCQVVRDGSPSNSARERHVQRAHSCYQGRYNQRKYESLQHPEEDLPDVGDVHHLPVRPVSLDAAETEPEHHTPDHPGHGGEGEAPRPQAASHPLHSGDLHLLRRATL